MVDTNDYSEPTLKTITNCHPLPRHATIVFEAATGTPVVLSISSIQEPRRSEVDSSTKPVIYMSFDTSTLPGPTTKKSTRYHTLTAKPFRKPNVQIQTQNWR